MISEILLSSVSLLFFGFSSDQIFLIPHLQLNLSFLYYSSIIFYFILFSHFQSSLFLPFLDLPEILGAASTVLLYSLRQIIFRRNKQKYSCLFFLFFFQCRFTKNSLLHLSFFFFPQSCCHALQCKYS